MILVIIGIILLFMWFSLRMSSICSRIEEYEDIKNDDINHK